MINTSRKRTPVSPAAARPGAPAKAPGPGPTDRADRDLGIPVIGRVPWGTHLCLFYRTRPDLIGSLSRYFRSGLENNEFCMWITSRQAEVPEAAEAMRSAMAGFGEALHAGQMEITPHTDWEVQDSRMAHDWVLASLLTKLRHARSLGYDGLRVSGNNFWLQAPPWDLDAVINRLTARYQMIALCTYPLDMIDHAEIEGVAAHHDYALVSEGDEPKLIRP